MNFNKEKKKMIRASKPKEYATSNGMVLLNPIKRILKEKPYVNSEFAYIANKELESAMDAMGDNETDVPNKVD